MDYLSRILLTLPRRDEEEGLLPILKELFSSAAAKQEVPSQQVSPTKEKASQEAAAELRSRYARLEQAAAVREVPKETFSRRRLSSAAVVEETNRVMEQYGDMGSIREMMPAAVTAEELSRVFERDARRYG